MQPLGTVCSGKLFWTWAAYTIGVIVVARAFDSLGFPWWAAWAAAGLLAVVAVERTLA